MTVTFIKIESTERHRLTWRGIPCEDKGRDWSDTSTSQGTPRIVGNHQQLEEVRGRMARLVP